jgi:small subunit ribosomal protein S4
MGRYTGPSCKLCRSEGVKLFNKGDRCFSSKCAMERKPFGPGMHGKARKRKKISDYGVHLREKQKVIRTYNLREKQFTALFDEASRKLGITGENFLILLELRLDSVVYKVGFGRSKAEARQLIRHGHILVNGKKVDIPSYRIKEGDSISVREKSKNLELIESGIEGATKRAFIPEWISFDKDKKEAKILRAPKREDIDPTIQERLIVEFYSK